MKSAVPKRMRKGVADKLAKNIKNGSVIQWSEARTFNPEKGYREI